MKTILIAEDEPAVLAMTALFLQKAGYTALKAADGQTALRLFEATPGIEALISDIRMPGLTGFELGRAVRVLSPSLPILLMSGFAGHTREDSQGLFEQQNIQFLPKPFTASQLIASVEMLFAMQAA
jgi:two-component system cell cycle sensor histidine kinase/response regulator CckA